MHTDKGILFSPAYDLLKANLIYPKDQEDLALTLGGRKRKIKRADFDQFAGSLGIATRVRDHIYKDFSERTVQIHDWIGNSFLEEPYKQEYGAIVDRKYNQISSTDKRRVGKK